ncbi:hypothetical protein O181_027539 [Austropuccinia psidii MF-1]|uniref:Uncharacterized protein n=1 Tax=Austropuccinia psidii MF-1 TaxID=1389203 RepID=A0A9Q3H2Q0_9BASI|nr:hypothetical protein [Austropuccinia psidii MF-1]
MDGSTMEKNYEKLKFSKRKGKLGTLMAADGLRHATPHFLEPGGHDWHAIMYPPATPLKWLLVTLIMISGNLFLKSVHQQNNPISMSRQNRLVVIQWHSRLLDFLDVTFLYPSKLASNFVGGLGLSLQ